MWWGKGVNHLLDAFSAVQDANGEPVSLLLVGDGADEPKLRLCARALGVENVVFAGFQQRWDLPRFYAAADVFTFPTLGEPFGLVVGEAMACGLPVVSTSAVGEIRDRVDEGVNGFIVKPADSKSMSRAMLRLVRDPHLRSGMGARSAARVAQWTPDQWAADFESAAERILAMPKV